MNNITIEFCDKIVSENSNFFSKVEYVKDIPFKIYSYRFGKYPDFRDFNAFELRGLAFNMNTKEPIWNVHKFFNIDEHEDATMDYVKSLTNLQMEEKVDGSIISTYVQNTKPSKNIYVKSNTSFASPQAKRADQIINGSFDKYRDCVLKLNDLGYQCIFEYISPENQIVVPYDFEKLVLIQVREKVTGEYYNFSKDIEWLEYFDRIGLPYKKIYDIDKDDIEEIYNWENCEGVVVTNVNHPWEKYKLKTRWYLNRHKLIGDGESLPTNKIIETVLEGEVDDILSFLTPASFKHHKVTHIRDVVTDYFNRSFDELFKILSEKEPTRKEMAIKYKQHPEFSVIMKFYDRDDWQEELENHLIASIKKKTNKLGKANQFLIEIDNEHRPLIEIFDEYGYLGGKNEL